MIMGIGIDLVKVSRIRQLYLKYKTKAPLKILSAQELKIFSLIKLQSRKMQYLAKRFVAKEALVKALGTGLSAETFLKDISVMNNELGRPYYMLSDKLNIHIKKLFKFHKYALHLSLSDDKDNALAIAILDSHDSVYTNN